jgi:hypothetical protein
MLRIVFDRTGCELLFKGFHQDAAKGSPRREISGTQEEAVIGEDTKIRIVLGVVTNIELYFHRLRVARDDKSG